MNVKLNEAVPAHKSVLEVIAPKSAGVECAGDTDYVVIRDMITSLYCDSFCTL